MKAKYDGETSKIPFANLRYDHIRYYIAYIHTYSPRTCELYEEEKKKKKKKKQNTSKLNKKRSNAL